MKTDKIKLGLPSGRTLGDPTIFYLGRGGVTINRPNKRKYVGEIYTGRPTTRPALPRQVYYASPAEITRLVGLGKLHLGVTGLDTVLEQFEPVRTDYGSMFDEVVVKGEYKYGRAGKGEQRIVLFAKRNSTEASRGNKLQPKDVVATEYPELTRRLFADWQVKAAIVSSRGSVEAHLHLGLANYGVTLMERGGTLLANDFVDVLSMARTYPVIVINRAAYEADETKSLSCVANIIDAALRDGLEKKDQLYVPLPDHAVFSRP